MPRMPGFRRQPGPDANNTKPAEPSRFRGLHSGCGGPLWIAEATHGVPERLDELLRQEPAQAKAEIAKHLDGQLTVRPLPSITSERRAEIRGRAGETQQPPGGPGGCWRWTGCGGWIWTSDLWVMSPIPGATIANGSQPTL